MKKLSDFDCFQALCKERVLLKQANVNDETAYELNKLINYVFSQEETNEYWICKIIDYINFNDENCNIKEPILLNYKNENRPSCLIISKNVVTPKLTSEDILDMKQGIKNPDYIIYDCEINPKQDMKDYYNNSRSLREVLTSIGLRPSIKIVLCEEIMSKLKDKEQKNNRVKKLNLIKKKS